MYFTVPAYFANMAPIVMKKLFKGLAKPIDNGRLYKGEFLFGKTKTWRGFIFAIIFGIGIAYVQRLLYVYQVPFYYSISITDYSSWLLIGFLLGTGAIIGDLAESYFKRRLKLKSGQKFIPFDQTDFVIGAYIFILPVFHLVTDFNYLTLFITTILVSFFLHIVTNHLSYYLKIRKSKW